MSGKTTELRIMAAKDGGFVVLSGADYSRDYPGGPLFAGSLDEGLAYMRAALDHTVTSKRLCNCEVQPNPSCINAGCPYTDRTTP